MDKEPQVFLLRFFIEMSEQIRHIQNGMKSADDAKVKKENAVHKYERTVPDRR